MEKSAVYPLVTYLLLGIGAITFGGGMIGAFMKKGFAPMALYVATAVLGGYASAEYYSALPSPEPLTTANLKAEEYVYLGRDKSKDPIAWMVLYTNAEGAVLISRDILYTPEGYDEHTVEWSKSELQDFITGDDFYFRMFSNEEQGFLKIVYDRDMITIPSKDELVNTENGFLKEIGALDSKRQAALSKDARDSSKHVKGDKYGEYYTKTPNGDNNIFIVLSTGAIDDANHNSRGIGIRPVIRLKISENICLKEGSGEPDDPFLLEQR